MTRRRTRRAATALAAGLSIKLLRDAMVRRNRARAPEVLADTFDATSLTSVPTTPPEA